MIVTEANSLPELVNKAGETCQNGTITNLILHGSFPYKETESDFIKTFESDVHKWQLRERPKDLFINHGEYIYKHGNAKQFLVEELKRKKDSNRAFLSLINMEDIIKSGDEPIPSFLLLQFSFSEEGYKKIFATAYFRALEVAEFLKINLAEICHFIRFLKPQFPDIEIFDLTIIACKGYYRPGYHCLGKAILDIASPVDNTLAVERKDIAQLKKWLDSKIDVRESVIYTDGLNCLFEAIQKCGEKYERDVTHYLREALKGMNELKETRKISSFSRGIDSMDDKIKENLEKAKEKLS